MIVGFSVQKASRGSLPYWCSTACWQSRHLLMCGFASGFVLLFLLIAFYSSFEIYYFDGQDVRLPGYVLEALGAGCRCQLVEAGIEVCSLLPVFLYLVTYLDHFVGTGRFGLPFSPLGYGRQPV